MLDLVKVSADVFLEVRVDLGKLCERGAYELSNDAVSLDLYRDFSDKLENTSAFRTSIQCSPKTTSCTT